MSMSPQRRSGARPGASPTWALSVLPLFRPPGILYSLRAARGMRPCIRPSLAQALRLADLVSLACSVADLACAQLNAARACATSSGQVASKWPGPSSSRRPSNVGRVRRVLVPTGLHRTRPRRRISWRSFKACGELSALRSSARLGAGLECPSSCLAVCLLLPRRVLAPSGLCQPCVSRAGAHC